MSAEEGLRGLGLDSDDVGLRVVCATCGAPVMHTRCSCPKGER
jgi:hypothetical protein